MDTKIAPYNTIAQYTEEMKVKVKICKVGLTVDQMESSHLERNVAGFRVFTRYFSARTSTFYHLVDIQIARGGIIIPNYIESWIIMSILVVCPLIAIFALALDRSFRDATGFDPVESSVAIAAILVFAGVAYFKTREYSIDWGMIVQRRKVAL